MIQPDTTWPRLDDAGREKAQRLAEAIRRKLSSGGLRPGAQLPTVRDLANHSRVTPGTVARAYRLLQDEGRLVAGVGRGTYVAEDGAAGPAAGAGGAAGAVGRAGLPPILPELGQAEIVARAVRGQAGRIADARDASAAAAASAVLDSLGAARVGPASAGDVVFAHGAQGGILSVLQVALPADAGLAIAPRCGPDLRAALIAAGLRIVTVPCDDQGLIPQALDIAAQRDGVRVVLTSSTARDPETAVTPLRRQAELGAVVRDHGLTVLDDLRVGAVGWPPDGAGFRTLLPDCTWAVTSPAHWATPALGVEAVIAPPGQAEGLRRAIAGGPQDALRLVQGVYGAVLRDPDLPRVLRHMGDWIAARASMTRGILGKSRVWTSDRAGFAWIPVSDDRAADRLCLLAVAEDLPIRHGRDFATGDMPAAPGVRLGYDGSVAHQDYAAQLIRLQEAVLAG